MKGIILDNKVAREEIGLVRKGKLGIISQHSSLFAFCLLEYELL